MFPSALKPAGLAAAVIIAFAATASAFPGGGVGVGGVGIGGVGSGVAAGRVSGGGITGPVSPGVPLMPYFTMQTQRFRDLNVTGQVGLKEGIVPRNATIVRLSLDGHEFPMLLDTELQTAELQFDPNASYARDLYRSILTKRIEVVGNQNLRDQIAQAVEQSKPLRIEGYVFDRTSPYLVVKSAKPQ